MAKKKKQEESIFERGLRKYAENLIGINKTLHFIMGLLQHKEKIESSELQKLFPKGKKKKIQINEYKKIKNAVDDFNTTKISKSIFERSMLESLIVEYDELISMLFRGIFKFKPDKLNNNDKVLSYADLMSLGSIETAQELVIEQKINDILRKNQQDRISYIKDLLKCESLLTERLADLFKSLIEINERRNILIHNGGKISYQYLNVMKKYGIKTKYKFGDTIQLGSEYMQYAFKVLFEFGIILGQTVRRRTERDASILEHADNQINTFGYELMEKGHNQVAESILEYGINGNNETKEDIKLYMILNKALAYKKQGKTKDMSKLLGSIDRSAKSPLYLLCKSALEGKFSVSYKYMIQLGVGEDKDVTEENYKTRIIFEELRKKEKFLETYKKIFNKDFIIEEEEKKKYIFGLQKKDSEYKEKKD